MTAPAEQVRLHHGCCAIFTGRPCDCETVHREHRHDHRHGFDDNVRAGIYSESGRLALRARFRYEAMTPDERAEVDREWADRSEWEREQIRAAVEFDLL